MQRPVRGTQTLVDQMSWVWSRASLTAIEVGWRWLFGIPFLLFLAHELKLIIHELPPVQFGLNNLDPNDPWRIAKQLSEAWRAYLPLFAAHATWFLPLAALGWILLSAVGRSLLFARMEPGRKWRPFAFIAIQAVQLAAFSVVLLFWWHMMGVIAAENLYIEGEPNLVGYLISTVLLTLGTYVAWALVSWPVLVAPVLVVLEGLSPWGAIAQGFHLGKIVSSKLVEINLVMGIVRLAMMVLASVLSAAPLPFGEQLGNSSLQTITVIAVLFNFVGNDYFQVVRLKSFIEFRKRFCAPQS